MKLIANATEQELTINFTLEQDGNDVNILLNGELVAYFSMRGEKVQLELVLDLPNNIKHLVHTEEDGNLFAN